MRDPEIEADVGPFRFDTMSVTIKSYIGLKRPALTLMFVQISSIGMLTELFEQCTMCYP